MQDLQAFSEWILHLSVTYAKFNGLWQSGQPLHFCETSGQLSTEQNFDIQKMTWLKIWNIYNINAIYTTFSNFIWNQYHPRSVLFLEIMVKVS